MVKKWTQNTAATTGRGHPTCPTNHIACSVLADLTPPSQWHCALLWPSKQQQCGTQRPETHPPTPHPPGVSVSLSNGLRPGTASTLPVDQPHTSNLTDLGMVPVVVRGFFSGVPLCPCVSTPCLESGPRCGTSARILTPTPLNFLGPGEGGAPWGGGGGRGAAGLGSQVPQHMCLNVALIILNTHMWGF